MTLPAALRANPGFRRYLAARVVSTAGTLLTAVVLPVLMYRLTGSAVWTAAVVVAEALPHLLLAPVAAPVAALLNRRKLLFTVDLTGAALLGGIPFAWWGGVLSRWHVLAVACGVQAVFVLRAAAQAGALQTLVGAESTAASGALHGSTGLVELMMPPLAGLAVTIVAPAGLLTLDALSFLAAALLVRAAIRGGPGGADPGPGPAPPRPRVRAGLRFLRASPPARTMALAGTLHAASGAAFLAVLLPWADQHLGVPPTGDARLALLVSCWGLGVILGRALCPALLRRLGPVRLARKGMGVALLCGLGMLAGHHWLLAVLVGLLWGAVHTVSANATRQTLGQPARSAARLLWRGVGPVTGAVLAGAFAAWSNPRAGLVISVTLLAVATVVVRCRTAPPPSGSVPTQGSQTGQNTQSDQTTQRPTGP